LGLDSYQLLFLQAPPSALLVFGLSALTEPFGGSDGLLHFDYTAASLAAILGTAALSFCVNLSIFLVIGRTSPVAYNVLGYFKLVCILASGFVFFREEANGIKVTGTAITFVGVCVYTQLQQSLKSGWEEREKAEKAEGTYPLLAIVSPRDTAKCV
jgi:solute carrier family 35 protein E3